MTPTTPAMTAQEQTAAPTEIKLRLYDRAGNVALEEHDRELMRTAAAALSDAEHEADSLKKELAVWRADYEREIGRLKQLWSDAERRATEAEGQTESAKELILAAAGLIDTNHEWRSKADQWVAGDLGRAMTNAELAVDLEAAQSRLSAVEARCGLMEKLLREVSLGGGFVDGEDHAVIEVADANDRDWIARRDSILAYPGGKSDDALPVQPQLKAGDNKTADTPSNSSRPTISGGKSEQGEKPPINLLAALRDAVAKSNPPAGGEGKPEPVAWMIHRVDSTGDRTGTVLTALSADHAEVYRKQGHDVVPLYTASLSRSGDSALVEAPGNYQAQAVLDERLTVVDVSEEMNLVADLDDCRASLNREAGARMVAEEALVEARRLLDGVIECGVGDAKVPGSEWFTARDKIIQQRGERK